MDVWQFNTGEWAEAYVFLKLLGDGRVYGADSSLRKNSNIYLDIIKIIRDEPDRYLSFERELKDEMAYIKALDHEACFKIITADELRDKAANLYSRIMSHKRKNAFSIPQSEEYLKSLRLASPKARLSNKACDKYGVKTDIIITSLSSRDNAISTEGFSIKSHLGASATLFNSSPTSGFIYRIKNCNEEGFNKINAATSSFATAFSLIKREYGLEYVGCRNNVFHENIAFVDSRMDEILQCGVLYSLGYYDRNDNPRRVTEMTGISEGVSLLNPLKRLHPENFYRAKFKDFLFDAFAGMTASKLWDGRKILAGGYLDVAVDGNILYYRAMSDEIFGNYLFQHTFVDYPDRGINCSLASLYGKCALEGRVPTEEEVEEASLTKNRKTKGKKNDWGYVYKEDGDYLLAINFQIRFT